MFLNFQRFWNRWRSLGESNPLFSQVDPLDDHPEKSSAIETYRCQSRLVCTSRRDRTSFAPETTQPKRNERDRIETKNSNINEADCYPAAHNGLVAGSRTALIVKII
jgi:hypothetical protein